MEEVESEFEFVDGRERPWEVFTDRSYFGLICVRPTGVSEFNDAMAFHFTNYDIANKFVELLKISK